MGWYVALFWEDCKYFCCSSQNNLMKSEIFLWAVSKIIDVKSLLKSALTGKDALMFLLEVVLTSFQVLCRSFHKFELYALVVLKKFMRLGRLSLLVQYFFLFFFVVDKAFLSNFWRFCSFHLVYLLKALMKLDVRKWLDQIEQRNLEKDQKVLVLLMIKGFFACWLLIPEQIL